ncbi:MAG: YeeE/YedE thiosulfate transporter family protein [Parachlamydiales bacterium]
MLQKAVRLFFKETILPAAGKLKNFFQKEPWPPYLAGALIGLITVFSLGIFQKTIGSSLAFVKFNALIWKTFSLEHLEKSAYYVGYLKNNFWLDWQIFLMLGLFSGAYLAGKSAGPKKLNPEPAAKETGAGLDSRSKLLGQIRKPGYPASFFGGMIVMIGARFAGGCTSGHAISGGIQLALSSWLYMIGLFAAAIPTALMLQKNTKGRP